MTAAIDEFVQLTKRTQEALTAAVQAWQESLWAGMSATDSPQPRLPDVRATVDAAFAFASQVLADQLEFAKALVSVGATSAAAVEDKASEQRRRASATSTIPPALPSPTTAALPAAPSREAAPVGDIASRTGTETAPEEREPAPQPEAAEPARSTEAPERIDDSTPTAGERVAASERLPARRTGTRTAPGKRSAPASSPAAATSTAAAKSAAADKKVTAARKTTAAKKTTTAAKKMTTARGSAPK